MAPNCLIVKTSFLDFERRFLSTLGTRGYDWNALCILGVPQCRSQVFDVSLNGLATYATALVFEDLAIPFNFPTVRTMRHRLNLATETLLISATRTLVVSSCIKSRSMRGMTI
jgi:hypothetical protein